MRHPNPMQQRSRQLQQWQQGNYVTQQRRKRSAQWLGALLPQQRYEQPQRSILDTFKRMSS